MNYLENIGKFLQENNLKIATTESCTGGLLSSALTDISGSSAYVELNLVTYSNEAKQRLLKVSPETLQEKGAVSEECAFEMAKGLFEFTNSDICVSTTGIAGPTGGTPKKPVGLMYSTIYTKNCHKNYKIQVDSNLSRLQIKQQFVNEVLKNIHDFSNLML